MYIKQKINADFLKHGMESFALSPLINVQGELNGTNLDVKQLVNVEKVFILGNQDNVLNSLQNALLDTNGKVRDAQLKEIYAPKEHTHKEAAVYPISHVKTDLSGIQHIFAVSALQEHLTTEIGVFNVIMTKNGYLPLDAVVLKEPSILEQTVNRLIQTNAELFKTPSG